MFYKRLWMVAYLKQGYKHIGTIEDYIEGYDRIYLRKKLG